MIDFAKITAKAGDGGNGSGSFHKIKGKRYGKADGGDGGRGGNVYIEATVDLSALEPYRYVKNYKAENGARGFSNLRRGAEGEDLVLKVPVGTVVKVGTSEFDLAGRGEQALVARGGESGRGNSHLRDEYGRRPKVGEKGQDGETVSVTLELKLLADVGLIGLPNAGKSTLLAKLTRALPKIAPYPFTTLEPNLGVLKSIVLADIPGLIAGASQGRGLGDLFLRHIERTKILVHLVDMSGEGNIWQDYQTIRQELKDYSKELAKKREIIVLSKADLASRKRAELARKEFGQHRKRTIVISAVTGEGLAQLVGHILFRASEDHGF